MQILYRPIPPKPPMVWAVFLTTPQGRITLSPVSADRWAAKTTSRSCLAIAPVTMGSESVRIQERKCDILRDHKRFQILLGHLTGLFPFLTKYNPPMS